MTQTEQILKHLRSGRTLTALSALHLFGCGRLAARILEINAKRKAKIKSEMVKLTSGKRIAVYRMG